MLRGKMSWKAHLQPQIKFSLYADKLEYVRGECLWVKITFLLFSKAPTLFDKHFWEHLCCFPTPVTQPCKTGLKRNQ